jgi:DNA-binding NarL/FixJ family response regulator
VADVLALIDDLFFQAKLMETARQVGVAVRVVANGDALAQAAEAQPASLVLVDLNARQGAMEGLTRVCAAGSAQVVAFLSHVQTDLAAQARAAGCTQVMPRSKFTADLPEILRRAKS